MTNNGTRMRMLHSAGKGAKRQPATGAGSDARKKTKRGAFKYLYLKSIRHL